MQGNCGNAVQLAPALKFLVSSNASDEVDSVVFLEVCYSKDRAKHQVGKYLGIELCNRSRLVSGLFFQDQRVPLVFDEQRKLVKFPWFRLSTFFELGDNEILRNFFHELISR